MQPGYVNMCSYSDQATNYRRFVENCLYYNADSSDITLTNLSEAKVWEQGIKCHYRLTYYTYRGWKVYMLMTGCFASKPSEEAAFEDENVLLNIADRNLQEFLDPVPSLVGC